MKTRVVNLRKESYDVYIGRPSKWGNPFKIGKDGTRDEVIKKYWNYILASNLIKDLHELKGKILGCYCKPLPCHGDVLVSLIEMEAEFDQKEGKK
jgi:hypothetical protein